MRVDGDNLIIEATANSITVPQGMELIYGEAEFPSYRRQFTLSRELDSARIEAKPATLIGVMADSAPPQIMTSASPR